MTSTLQLDEHAVPAGRPARTGMLPTGARREPEAERRLVLWTSGVCVLFLGIGLLGMKAPAESGWLASVAPEAALVPVEFQPHEPRPAPESALPLPPGSESAAVESVPVPDLVTPMAVVTVPELVPFAVPVPGPIVPALRPLEAVVPTTRPVAAPSATPNSAGLQGVGASAAGTAGPRTFQPGEGEAEGIVAPKPEYPQEAQRRMISGAVKLEIEVTEAGTVGEVRKLVPSGSVLLDNHTVSWVRRRWKFPAGRRQLLHTEFVYELAAGR